MRGGVGVAKAVDDGGRAESQNSNDSGSPLDTNKINSLSVGNTRFDTSDGLARATHIDVNTDFGIEIGNGVSNAGDGAGGFVGNVNREVNRNLASVHGAKTLEFLGVGLARVDGLAEELVTVGRNGQVELDLALNGGSSRHMNKGTVVTGSVGEVELLGSEQ